MPSTYSASNRVELQGEYENYDGWGPLLNQALNKLDEAVDGLNAFDLSGTKDLTALSAVSDEASKRWLRITGGTGGTINLPAVAKWYFVRNGATGVVTIQVTGSAGASVAVPPGESCVVLCDGVDCFLEVRRDQPVMIGSTPTASGATVTVPIDRSFYQSLEVHFAGVSHNSGSLNALTVAPVRQDGSYPAGTAIGLNRPATTTLFGCLQLCDKPQGAGYSGCFTGSIDAPELTGSTMVVAVNASVWPVFWRGDSIRFGWNNGGSFDGGAIEVWAR